jgi:formylglycine-generating enzyme required for sulfatase activity
VLTLALALPAAASASGDLAAVSAGTHHPSIPTQHGTLWARGWNHRGGLADTTERDTSGAARQTPQRTTTGPHPPASVEPASGGLPEAAAVGETVILGVPAYLWRHGCGPTAVGMVLGYYDGHGFGALFAGSAVTQTAAVNQGIASQGSSTAPRHYEDYSLPMDQGLPVPLPDNSERPLWPVHFFDSVADFMHTSWSVDGNTYGGSSTDMVGHAFLDFALLRFAAYSPTSTAYAMGSTLTWALVKTEINASRPMVFLVDSDGDGTTDHGVPIIGYRETNGYREYACWDTWSTTNIRWARFRAVSGSYDWGVSGGVTFGLTSPAAPTITVTTPNGGEVWGLRSTPTIRWTWTNLNAGSNVKIELSRNGGTAWTTLIASTPNDGAHPWTVSGAATSRARVRITSTANGQTGVSDASNANFTLGTAAAITVTSPNGGEVWPLNSTKTIRWTSSGLAAAGYVKIEHSRDGGSTWTTIVLSTPNDGSHPWAVGNVASTRSRVRITGVSPLSGVSDASNADFTLGGGASTLTMIPVPAGAFQRDSNAANTSSVSAFSMSETEITRAQWTAVTGRADPSYTQYSTGTNDPVQNVNWYHALVFCNKLSMREGRTPVYTIGGSTDPAVWGTVPTTYNNATWEPATANWSATGYRLPTEMEWMWAAMGARDGTTGYLKAFAGSTGSNAIGGYAWHSINGGGLGENANGTTHPVGTKRANELGLHDMSGNVWEWCWDWYATYPSGSLSNYRGAASGTDRVKRGGSWYFIASYCPVALRDCGYPADRFSGMGFRVVRP